MLLARRGRGDRVRAEELIADRPELTACYGGLVRKKQKQCKPGTWFLGNGQKALDAAAGVRPRRAGAGARCRADRLAAVEAMINRNKTFTDFLGTETCRQKWW
jgi:hypothetical protein